MKSRRLALAFVLPPEIELDAEPLMASETITVPVDPEAAKAFKASAPENQRKIQALLGLWLRDLTKTESSDLKGLMEDISRRAKAQGLTPEILDSLLKGA